jgi:hypothetical protein
MTLTQVDHFLELSIVLGRVRQRFCQSLDPCPSF